MLCTKDSPTVGPEAGPGRCRVLSYVAAIHEARFAPTTTLSPSCRRLTIRAASSARSGRQERWEHRGALSTPLSEVGWR